jgi:transposase
LISTEAILGLPEYEITALEEVEGQVQITVRFVGRVECPHCGGEKLGPKDRRIRRPRHESWGVRHCVLALETRKWCAGPAAAASGSASPEYCRARERPSHSGALFARSISMASAGAA